jgi:hypothetical protein
MDDILVHPLPTTLAFTATFSHQELRIVPETRYEQEQYLGYESYSCGAYEPPSICTRSVLRFRMVPRTEHVPKYVAVEDGACTRTLRFAPVRDRTYVIQFTFQASEACALSCFEQATIIDGVVARRPCAHAQPESN